MPVLPALFSSTISILCLLGVLTKLPQTAAVEATLVSDITPGSGDTTFYGTAFTAPDGVTNYFITPDAIYRTNGTPGATVGVPLPDGVISVANNLVFVGDSVFFRATSSAHGAELHRLTGSAISMVADINVGTADGVGFAQVVGDNSRFVFVADDGGGSAAWFVDGTNAPVKLTGAGTGAQVLRMGAGSDVLFVSSTGLWQFDMDSAIAAENPQLLSNQFNNSLAGSIEITDGLLWYTSSKIFLYNHVSGLTHLADFPESHSPFFPRLLEGPEDVAYFFLFDYQDTPVIRLWSSDGTAGGTSSTGASVPMPAGNNLDIIQHQGRYVLLKSDHVENKSAICAGSAGTLELVSLVDTRLVHLGVLNGDLSVCIGDSISRIRNGDLEHLWSLPGLDQVYSGLHRWFVRASPGGTSRVFAIDQDSCIEIGGDYSANILMASTQDTCLFTATASATGKELYRVTGLRPSCRITPDRVATNATSVTFDLVFSVPVIGFSIDDIAVTGGLAGTFSGSGAHYTLEVQPDADAVVTVSVSDAAANEIGDGSATTEASATIISDRTAPVVTINPQVASTGNNPVRFTVAATGAVTSLGDITPSLSGGTLIGMSGSATLVEMRVNPTASGAITMTIPANTVFDLAGNGNAPSDATITYEPTLVGVSISPNAVTSNETPLIFTITFTAAVTGFTIGDVAVIGGTATALSGSGTTYALTVIPSAEGAVTVSFVDGVAHDGSGNPCSAGFALVNCDQTGPTVTLTSPSSHIPVGGSVTLTALLSEPVATLNAGKIVVSGGTLGSISGSGNEWRLRVTALGEDGIMTVTMQSGAATDIGSNPSSPASRSLTVGNGPAPGGSGGSTGGSSGAGGGCGLGSGAGVTMLLATLMAVPLLRMRRRRLTGIANRPAGDSL